MTELERKIRDVFQDACVLKSKQTKSVFAGKNLPSFIKDFLLKRYTDETGILDKHRLLQFLERHLPPKNTDIKFNLMQNQEEMILLTNFIVESDVAKGVVRFAIPDLGIQLKDGIVPRYVLDGADELGGGEHWGSIKLLYVAPEGREKGYIEMTSYKPFKPYRMNVELYKQQRAQFDVLTWIDVLLRAMEYDASTFESLTQKLRFLARLLIFVEPNLNIVELAPKGTGKSYVFGNLSKYGWMMSGVVSRAKLFYDMQQKSKGAIARYDFVAMDEVHKIRFTDDEELASSLQSYLEAGWTAVGNTRIDSKAGLMLLGNIPLDERKVPLNRKYFDGFRESVFQETALLDRFHGFIEGWQLPRIKENMLINGWTINAEYFTEMLSKLRDRSEYAMIVDRFIAVPNGADLRDTKAVKRLATAFLKLLFPHVETATDISASDFKNFCFDPAMRMRSIIREQMHYLDREYSKMMPRLEVPF